MVMERGKKTRTFIFVSLDAAGLSLDNYNEREVAESVSFSMQA